MERERITLDSIFFFFWCWSRIVVVHPGRLCVFLGLAAFI